MNLLFILEGNEEAAFFDCFDKYINKDCFNVEYLNAGGFGLVGPYFQSHINSEYYDAILCVYDVDNKANDSSSPFNNVRNALKDVLGDYKKADGVSVCSNPNIMQLFLLGCDKLDNVKMSKTSKTENTKLFQTYWPKLGNKKAYDASSWQLDIIKDSFLYDEFDLNDIFKNGKSLSKDYINQIPASNMISALDALKNGKIDYFKKAIDIKQDKHY